ncbi:MAG: MarR family transcriptional regulator [Mycobacterium sp.]|nr:MAG: MarR family transcriptional regulator [Mycobacterium sp.]
MGAKPQAMWLPGLDENEQRSWREFVESSTGLLVALNQTLTARHQLDLFELRLLDFLAKSDTGSARMSELAEALMLLRSRVTWLTRRLETRGLLRRARIQGDGRAVLAEITTEGRTRVAEANRTYAQEIRRLYVNQMSRQQMLALGAACQRINASLVPAEVRTNPGDN